jgi:predicted phage tail protein
LKTIKLYGVLAKKFGKEFRLDVDSTREAVKALSVQIPGFEHFMLHAHEQGLAFAVFQDKENIGESELLMSTSAKTIKIVPRVMGSGGNSGILQVVLGVVMIAAAFVTGGTSIAAWGALEGALFGAGVGMMVGGVAQMLMPKVETTKNQNEDGNKANFGFGGAVTTIAQGNPVPVLYGQREVGGFIASAGQYPEDKM